MRQRQATGDVPVDVLRKWVVAIYRRSWTWCATLPFPTPMAPQQATEFFQSWLKRLEQRTEAPVPTISVLESDRAGVIRIYALLAGVESLRYTTGAKEWRELTGMMAGIFAFDSERDRQCTLDIAATNSVAFGKPSPQARAAGPERPRSGRAGGREDHQTAQEAAG
jgi:hypothetical protein